jgi:hypothetical protein
MSREVKYKLLVKFSVLALLCLGLWGFSGGAGLSQGSNAFVPVTPRQLLVGNGPVPVELRCSPGQSSAAGVLDPFTCVLRNNTGKDITAANVIYSIVVDQNGVETKAAYASTIDTTPHPDFAATSRPIRPGTESVGVGPPGPTSYEGAVIKGVEVSIDYVEFADGSRLGPDQQGSRIIGDMRRGADKYKNWLRAEYGKGGQPPDAIIQMLNSRTLPSELKFASADEEQGARSYRNRLRKVHESKGEAEVRTLLRLGQS